MSLGSIPSYLLRVVASWLTGCFCMIVWWFMYLVVSDHLCLGQLMTEFFKQAIPNLGVIMSFSLPVGVVLGEILSGIWELTVSLLPKYDSNYGRAGNLCSRPFEQFATSLGYKIAAKKCNGKNEIANITIGEFASIFNRENAYNASEIHFALARCLGGVSIGLLGGLIFGLLFFLVNFLWKCFKKSKICICDFLCSFVSILLILAGLVVAIFLYVVKDPLITELIIALIFIPVSFFAFCLSLRYRDFANFIIIISKCCNAQLGKTKNLTK